MIGKIIPRKQGVGSFRDSVNYNLGLSRNDTDKVEYVNMLNIFEPSMAIKEMEAIASENTLSKNPVFNCILSWRENEIPSHQQADEAVRIVLEEMGLEECQVHYALHRNTQNLHLHICVNRIHPETHRAIDPAHGWTKKAIERASRKIELAQGWPIEQSGRYTIAQGGEIIEKSPEDQKGLHLSQTGKDIEAHTGAKCAERIAQEIATPIIKKAKSWEELHKELAENGIAYEKKCSGAILRIGDVVIKASSASRDASIAKLEKRLGAFIERSEETVIKQQQHEQPIEQVASSPKVKNAWMRYQDAKKDYLLIKKSAGGKLTERHKQERKQLLSQQSKERAVLLSVSWKGRGTELNQQRSVMSAEHKKAYLTLRDSQQEEREVFKKSCPPFFPSFKAWLSQEKDATLSVAFRYPEQAILFSGEEKGASASGSPTKQYDLRNYSAVFGGRERGVMYRKNGSSVADFIDYGRRIVLSSNRTEESVLAALQLASQKWGAVQLGGTEDYKKLCVQIAAKHNIKISNPELRQEVESARKTFKQERYAGNVR